MTTDLLSWSCAAADVADELLTQAGITAPPVDALELCNSIGIVVAFDAGQEMRGRHKRIAEQPTIFLKPDERPERLQWAAAHELGEAIVWRVFARGDCADETILPHEREAAANLLASRLLLPRRWFVADARGTGYDLLELKRIYATASHELIAWRMLDLEAPAIVSLFDQGRLMRRRADQGRRPPPLHALEQRAWQQVHKTSRCVCLREEGLCVQAWPVHEPHWRREFVRFSGEPAA